MKYKIGDIIKCRVTGIENYGFFVEVDKNYKGLVHISEISNSFVRKIEDYVSLNEQINAKIIDINYKTHQLKLSIKNINYNNDSNFSDSTGFTSLKNNLNIWIRETLEKDKK